ncbi:hypothetical protein GCM10020255_058370 [Rhodococcus baikonurensis]
MRDVPPRVENSRTIERGEGSDAHENRDDDQKLQLEELRRQSVPARTQARTQWRPALSLGLLVS